MDQFKEKASIYLASLQAVPWTQHLDSALTNLRGLSYGALLLLSLKAFFTLILLRFTILTIYRLYFHPLRNYPGPFLAKITNLYSLYYDWWLEGQLTHHVRTVLHPKYGPIVRTRPHTLRFSDPEAFHQIHSVGYTFIRDVHTNTVWNMPRSSFSTDPKIHKARKTKIAPVFTRSRLAPIEPLVEEKTKLLIDKIALRLEKNGEDQGEDGKVLWLNVSHALLAYVLDIVQEFLSEGVGAYRLLENDDSPDFHAPISDLLIMSLKLSHWHRHFPNAAVFMQNNTPNWLLEYMAPFLKNRKDITARIHEGVYGYLKTMTPEELELKPKSIPNGANKDKKLVGYKELIPHFKDIPEDFVIEAQLLIAAGANTTAYVMAFLLYQLAVDQDLQDKLVREINGLVIDGPGKMPGWRELEECELLTAIIKESLRLSDPISEALARQTTKPVNISGSDIPVGTTVEIAASQTLHNPAIFGLHPEKFDHTRFLRSSGISEDQLKQRIKFANTVFAGGAYVCTGMNMAYMELYVGTARLLRNYRFELSEDLKRDGAWLWQDAFVAWKIGAEPILGIRRRY